MKKNKVISFVVRNLFAIAFVFFACLSFSKNSVHVYASGEEISTIGEVFSTYAPNFPKDNTDAWINENDQITKAYIDQQYFHFGMNTKLLSTHVTGSGNQFTAILAKGDFHDSTAKFNIEGGKLVSIEISYYESDPQSNGIYKEPPVTISSIKPSNFPNSESSYWINENLERIYLQDENDGLCFNNLGSLVSHFPNKEVTKNNDNNYEYTFTYGDDEIKIELIMNDNTFNALKVSGFTSDNAKKNGTYTVPVIIDDILPNDFPASTSAWVNGANKAYKEIGVETELFIQNQTKTVHIELTKNVVKISDTQYKYADSYYGYYVTFNLENNVLTSITFDGGDGDFSSLNGTYYPQPKVNDTFTAGGINYVVTSVGDTNTVAVGDNKSFAETSVTIPAKVTYKDVDFSVTSISWMAFYNCQTLTSVSFAKDSQIVLIEANAFYYAGIREIVLPSSIKTIEEEAFYAASNLTTFKILAKEVPMFGEDIFTLCPSLEKIYVPVESVDAYKTALGDYKDKIEAFYTIADILATVEGGFPTTEATAWVNTAKNSKIFIKEGQLSVTKVIDLLQQSDNVYSVSRLVEVDTDNNYVINGTLKIKFFMKNNKLSSILISCDSIYQNSFVLGTFTAPTTIADVLATVDFPTTQANVWKTKEGGISYLVLGDSLMFSNVVSIVVPTTEFVALSGSNYIYSLLGGYSVTFNMENDKLISISFDTLKDSMKNLNGEYKPVSSITKPTADTTNFVYDGNAKTYQLATNDAYTISGDELTQTNAGTYTITVSLRNAQYKWADGTTDDITYKFVINQKVETVKVTEDGVEIDRSEAKVSIIEAEEGIDPNAVFVIKTIPNTNTESINNTENILRENNKLEKQEVVAVYDAKLLVNNVEVQPNGIIKIKMLVPEEVKGNNFKLYHIHNGTEVIEVDYTAVDENGYITFETDKLSEFAFATDVKNAGLSAWAIFGIILGSLLLLAIVAYVLGYFFLYKKGKLDERAIKVIYEFLPKGNKK